MYAYGATMNTSTRNQPSAATGPLLNAVAGNHQRYALASAFGLDTLVAITPISNTTTTAMNGPCMSVIASIGTNIARLTGYWLWSCRC